MIIVGSIDEDNVQEITNISKIVIVGLRVQALAQIARRQNENNNQKKN